MATTTSAPSIAIEVPERAVRVQAFRANVLWALLIVGCLILVAGLLRSDVLTQNLWKPDVQNAFVAFAVASMSALAAVVVVARSRWHAAVTSALIAAVVLMCGLAAALSVGYITVACYALGDLTLGGQLSRRFHGRALPAVLATLVGLAIAAWLVGFTAHFPVNRPALYVAGLAVPIVLDRRRLAVALFDASRWLVRPRGWNGMAAVAALAVSWILTLHLGFVGLPELYHDALVMHLRVATDMLGRGQWGFDFQEMVGAVTPMGADWSFAIGFLLGGESAARLVNLLYFAISLCLLLSVLRQSVDSASALWATALLASAPMAFVEDASLFSENALMAFQFGALVWLAAARSRLVARDLVGIGLLLGAALDVKLQAVFFVGPAALLALIFWFRSEPDVRSLITGLIGGVLAIVAFGAPPYAYAWLTTGNPVFPFFNAIFKSPYFAANTNFDNPLFSGHFGLQLLYDMTFNSSAYLEAANGAFGFQFVAMLAAGTIAVIFTRQRLAICCAVVAAICFVSLSVVTQYIRYVYPLYPEMMVVCGAFVAGLAASRGATARLGVGIFAALSIVLIGLNLLLLPSAGWILGAFDPRALLDPQARTRFISEHVPQRRLIDVVNASDGPNARLLVIGAPVLAALEGRPVLLSWYNPSFNTAFSQATSAEAVRDLLHQRGVTHVMLPDDNAIKPDLRLLHQVVLTGGVEIARAGGVSLVKLRDDVRFRDELLTNTGLTDSSDPWSVIGSVSPSPSGVGLTLAPHSQIGKALHGPLQSGNLLEYTARVHCLVAGSSLRLQIAWIADEGKGGNSWLVVRSCVGIADDEQFVERVSVPQQIAGAVVFAISNDEPIELQSVSLRR